MKKEIIVLGEGVLNWFRVERQADRYGSVYLGEQRGSGGLMDSATDGCVQLDRSADGQKGKLFAVVLKTTKSNHIGDLARGIGPTTPKVGERIYLGEGTLFFDLEVDDGITFCQVGVHPADDRKSDWMDPRAMYRCHVQTVRLEFEPELS